MIYKLNKQVSILFTEEGFIYSNCLLVDDEVRVLVDTGAGKLMEEIEPQTVDIVMNSHHHYDHVRGNELCSAAKILLHPLEHPPINMPEKVTATTGWEDLMHEDYTKYSKKMRVSVEKILHSRRVDGEIHDGQVIDCGRTKIQVLHTPGHSSGHCSFFLPEEGLVFLGDICLTKVGPWYGDPEADIDAFISSINRILELKPDRLVSGHVNNIILDKPEVLLLEYRDRIYKREQRLLKNLIDNPQNIHELADKHLIYLAHPTPFVLFWEKCMIKKHLERLARHGQVEQLENGNYRRVS